jgi:hypothetical protein
MMKIGVDDHPSSQQFAFMDQETGECGERRLNHGDGEGESFYRELKQRGVSVCVGMEATGYSRWFERLLAELGIEVRNGDAAKIKTKRVRKQQSQEAEIRTECSAARTCWIKEVEAGAMTISSDPSREGVSRLPRTQARDA